jgi:hypothetical protein
MSALLREVIRPIAVGLVAALALGPGVARADNDPAVQRGIEFLRRQAGVHQVGESAMMALAMLKADVPPGDPALAACLNKVRARFSSGIYNPERRGGSDIYETAVVCMALSNLDSEARRSELSAAAQYLISKQKANGSWDYDGRTAGDSSISQYAVLGLWEAENGGVDVPPRVWDNAAQWYRSVQSDAGSWSYHRDEAHYPETVSMTAAGVGSLLICQRQLDRYRRVPGAGSNLLKPLVAEGARGPYDVHVKAGEINQSVNRGLRWLAANFTTGGPQIGQSAYYGLYGIERIGALADRETIGRVNWFEQGRQFITSTQRGDGAWDSQHGTIPNTVWALLFLTKSTQKSVRKVEIRRLGAGTLVGGRYLPKDLSNMTVAGGRVVSRPMNGAVEGMLAVLEDPRSENADAAVSGLVNRFRTEGPGVLRPYKDRFRMMLGDRDPGVRKVAAWALARTGDLDTAPALIEALTDRDEDVVRTAREGLQLLSRKLEGLGPTSPSTPEQRREAADRWRAWYAAIRPLDTEGQDEAADRAAKPIADPNPNPDVPARSPR